MRLRVKFHEADQFIPLKFDFSEVEQQIPLKFESIQEVHVAGRGAYDGPYSVTPTVDEQKLETAQKIMLDDVTVKAIPYYTVSNVSGGTTIYIADTLE